jgi:hypothetical protein
MGDPIDRLLSRLEGVRRSTNNSWMARCPCHEDRSPSLSIREASDGRVLIYDFGGCGATEIVQAVGLDLADLYPPKLGLSRGNPKLRDPAVPRVSAQEALRLLDEESLFLVVAAEALSSGTPPESLRVQLGAASNRIAAIRQLWEMQP